MEIELDLADSLIEVVGEARVAAKLHPLFHYHPLTTSTFVESHRLLLAQSLALEFNDRHRNSTATHQAGDSRHQLDCFLRAMEPHG